MITETLKPIVPGYDNCAALKVLGFPQETALVYVDGIRHRLEVGTPEIRFGQLPWIAAPTAAELQAVFPPRYFVMSAGAGKAYMLIDAMQTSMKEAKDEKGNTGKGVVFHMVKEATADSIANCWAKGFIFLISTGVLQPRGASSDKKQEGDATSGTKGLGAGDDGQRPEGCRARGN